MKSELATAIVAAVAGVLISYFVTGLFIGEIEPVSVKTVETSTTAELSEPNPEVFNYKSLNPTVEIYIGNGDSNDNDNENDSNEESSQEDSQENL